LPHLASRKEHDVLQLLTDLLSSGFLDAFVGVIDIISWED
jgi:hypothetical protein